MNNLNWDIWYFDIYIPWNHVTRNNWS